jgi:hypothetical protein
MVEGARAKALPPCLCTAIDIDKEAIGWSGRETVRLARQGQSRISNRFIHCLSAVVGSTELARTAGIKHADPAAKARTTAEPMNVNGSRGSNPKSWLRIRLARARASASEKPQPS